MWIFIRKICAAIFSDCYNAERGNKLFGFLRDIAIQEVKVDPAIDGKFHYIYRVAVSMPAFISEPAKKSYKLLSG